MTHEFEALRPLISQKIVEFVAMVERESTMFSSFSPDLGKKLSEYSLRGKMIRGCLVPLTLKALGNKDEKLFDAALSLGAVMELVQSMLLIHDDIMDQDTMRRGKPSIHTLYEKEGEGQSVRDQKRYGESMGICLGDVAGFISFLLVSRINIELGTKLALTEVLAKELVCVGLAQMDDVANGHRTFDPSIDQIVSLYRFKTGRYTFSLPFVLALLLLKKPKETIGDFGSLGELFGILFQIKDDEIGLMADSKQSGKPQGNDICEDKKTLYRYFMMRDGGPSYRDLITSGYGNKSAKPETISKLIHLHHELKVVDRVQDYVARFEGEARVIIDKITHTEASCRDFLMSILSFNIHRTW